MPKGVFEVPYPTNEPVKSYAPGSPEKEELLAVYKELNSSNIEVPMYIGSEEIKTDVVKPIFPPHNHKHQIGSFIMVTKAMLKKPLTSH